MADKELKNLQIEIKKLTKKLDSLDINLSKHIVFIEQVYAPLQKSIPEKWQPAVTIVIPNFCLLCDVFFSLLLLDLNPKNI